MINTNLPPILHYFRDIAVDRSEIAILGYPLCLTPPTEGFPWDDLHEIFSGCQRMAKVPNAIEILRKISTTWVGRTSVTDRQTDGRAIAYSERELTFTFAKNEYKALGYCKHVVQRPDRRAAVLNVNTSLVATEAWHCSIWQILCHHHGTRNMQHADSVSLL